MLLTIHQLLGQEDLARVVADCEGLAFVDGKASAGLSARAVKHNQQATGPQAQALLDFVRRALDAHPVFQAATQIRAYGPMLVSRYGVGDSYGLHVDNAFMGEVRSDLSFTLFLSPLESYDGGGLTLEWPSGSQTVRLSAGDLVLYPSTSLHRVEPVTRGHRLAIVGWVESRIRHTEAREALFDLANVRVSLDRMGGVDPLVSLTLQKVQANLLRLLS